MHKENRGQDGRRAPSGPSASGKAAPFRVFMGVAGILLGISLPIREFLDWTGGSPVRGPLTLERAAFFSVGLWDAFLAVSLAACGGMFLRARPRAPWMGALCGGGVLVDAAYLFVTWGPAFYGVLCHTRGTRYSEVALWAAVWLFLLSSRVLWALAVLGVSLSVRGRSAFPPPRPPLRAAVYWTTAGLAAVFAAGVRFMIEVLSRVALG